jgi:hypothetical protein
LRPTIGKIAMALAVASVMGAMAVPPALGQNNEGRGRAAQDHGRNDNRNQSHNRNQNNSRDQRESRPVYRPVYQDAYRYSQPVYAPPPVYYEPQQSPGISLFFPLDIRF